MADVWNEYAALVRELDEVRATEQSRTEGLHVAVAEMTHHADSLDERVINQQQGFAQVAQLLRFRMPKLGPVEPEGIVDPATDLARVAEGIDTADRELHHAATRGQQPQLLPDWSPLGRAMAIYGAAAVLIVLLQLLSFVRGGSNTSSGLVLFMVPLLGFAIGYLTLKIGTRTRVPQATPEIYTRIGLILSFAIGPLVLLVFALAAASFGK
ncbi:hypothetical protein ACIB24_14760 [Spongisporangium articulatum]|uniref:DUF4239 domain-containing protein n=1 Tax=Spongisporangium articulatum TaxID=3362603 RepID=A0ABW8APM2_9ACTN